MTSPARALILAALLLTPPLAGCGKRASLEPPEGREAEFTYPRFYPPPPTMAPPAAPAPSAEAEDEEELPSALSPFPQDRSRTRTYGAIER